MRAVKERLVQWLRWSERYTKTDMVYFFKGNFWLNLSRASSVLNGLVLSVAFAHLLTKEEYGLYAFALAFMGFFSMAQTSGLGAGIIKGVARGGQALVFEGLRRVLPWSLAGAILLASSAAYYAIMGNGTLAIVFSIGALVLPISIANGVSKSYFSVKGEFETLARFNIARTPAMTGVLVAVAILTGSPLWILIANSLGNAFLGWLLYRKMKRHMADHPETMESAPAEFDARFGYHSGFLSIFGYLSEQLDDLLLWKFAGAAPVAVYTYATTPVRELRQLLENQSTLALPKFAQKEFSEVRAGIFSRVKQMYWIALPLIALYVAAAPYIFQFLFPQYMEAVPFSQLASLSLLAAPRRLISAAITAHHKVKESYIMTLLPSAIRIALALTLIPTFGIQGAIWAFLLAELADYCLLGILMRHK